MIGMADTINAIRPALDEMAEARAEVARLTAELAAARAVPADVEAAIIAYRDAAQSFGMSALIDGGAALRTAIARAISDATAARGTVGGQTGPVGKLLGSHAIVEWYLAPRLVPGADRPGRLRHGAPRRPALAPPTRAVGHRGQPWGARAAHGPACPPVPATEADADPGQRGPLPKGG